MKVLLQSTVVFFGTLLAAALIALGAPAEAEVRMAQTAPQADAVLVALLAAD
jgi:hypothetical protein